MAPGLIGPAQLGGDEASDNELDDAYVEGWSLWRDVQLLVGRRPAAHHSVSKSSS
jgi:lipopolysaccharide/colanic/teichoic acid biosynthesis glycosyltransferase